jgi:aryl-alcohol dehydrogenase-like predicted oxidoreductase
MAIRFALSHPDVSTVLVGYSDVAQLEAALHAVEQGPLPGDLNRRLVDLARSRR